MRFSILVCALGVTLGLWCGESEVYAQQYPAYGLDNRYSPEPRLIRTGEFRFNGKNWEYFDDETPSPKGAVPPPQGLYGQPGPAQPNPVPQKPPAAKVMPTVPQSQNPNLTQPQPQYSQQNPVVPSNPYQNGNIYTPPQFPKIPQSGVNISLFPKVPTYGSLTYQSPVYHVLYRKCYTQNWRPYACFANVCSAYEAAAYLEKWGYLARICRK